MAGKGKKKKPHHPQTVPAGELLKLAEARLQSGRPEEAVRLLRELEEQLRRAAVPAAGKARPSGSANQKPAPASLPPHMAAVQPRVAPLLARALFEHALTVADPPRQIAALEEAVRQAPAEPRYALALGACHLAFGRPEPALESIRQARQLAPPLAVVPPCPLVGRAFALALLAAGHTREVKEWLKGLPAAGLDSAQKRLAAIRSVAVEVTHDTPADHSLPAQLIASLTLLATGDVERARERLSALPPLDRNPDRSEAAVLATQLFYSGILQFHAGRGKEAAAELREAQRLTQGHVLTLPWLERIAPYLHQIAAAAVRQNEINRAADLWSQILEQDPGDKIAAANLKAVRGARANAAWHAGEWPRAVELWKEALHANPQDEQLLRSLAVGAEKVGQKEEAIDRWRALAHAWRQQAKRRSSEGGFTDRLMLLEQHLVGLMLEADRPPVQVLHELESALKIDATNDALRRKYADLLMELGRTEAALKQLEQIERNQGESAELLTLKGMALDLLGRRPAARKALQRALELEPSHPLARQGFLFFLDEEAMAAEQQGDNWRAQEICHEQLTLDPEYPPAVAHLAALSFSAGDDQEAKNLLARLVAAEPGNPRRYISAGMVYLAFNKVRLADSQFKRAVELEPSEPCFFHIGSAYLKFDNIKKALKHFERAAESGSLETLLAIAGSLAEADYFDEALPFLDRAIAKYPHDPDPHVTKAAMWLDLARIPEAQSELKEAERLAAGRSEFAETLDEIREMKQEIRDMQELVELGPPPGMPPLPPELLRLLGKSLGRR